MMKRIVILTALVAGPAFAQQMATDPIAVTYAQLLSEANGRVVGLSAEVAKKELINADLQKQLDAIKPKDKPDAK